MYNKKALRDIVKNLGSAKAPTKKRDIIYDPMGQWTNPGQDTRVPTPNGNITMGANPETGQPIPFPVFAQPNVGPGVMMQPGQDYTFPGAKYVDEFPQVKKGGLVKQPKKYSKSLMAKNILFVKNAFINKKKSVKNKIFDPNSPYFEDGGTFEIELDDAEIDQYKQGGYIVEELDAYAKGGSSSCPKDHVWDSNTKKCVKVYTLANDKKLIDGVSNWAMQSNDPDKISSEYNDQIKHYLYSGKYGYDPVSGTLYPLKKEQKTVADAETKKILAKQDDKAAYTQSIIDAGFDPDTFGKSKGTNVITGEEIYGDKSQEDVDKINKEAVNDFVTEGHRKAILESPFNTAAFFTPAGMAAGVMQGAANLLPDAYDFAKDPSWSGAGAVGMDALMMSPAAKGLGKALGTDSGLLSKTYKINPWAFKPNQSKFYRQIGKAGLDDALSSNVIKSADQTTFPRPYFVEGKDFKMLEQTGSGAHGRPSVMFETPGVNSEGFPFVSPANGSAEYTPWIADMAEVPLTEGKLLQKDWLQGYKEVPRELPGSPNAVFSKYLTPKEAAIARAERMLAQEPKWQVDSNNYTKNKFTNINNNFEEVFANEIGKSPKTLGVNSMGKAFVFKDNGLSAANQARVSAHETGHFYKNMADEANEWNSFFDFSKLKNRTNIYLRGKPTTIRSSIIEPKTKEVSLEKQGVPHGDEIRERAAQLKDYIAQKNGIPLNKDFKVTQAQLDDAIKNYVKDTGLDNSMSPMLNSLKDKKGFLKAMNKYALGNVPYIVPAAIGVGAASQIPQNKYGGLHKLEEKKIILDLSPEEIQQYKNGGYIVEDINEYKEGGTLLTKKVTCKNCGWTWDAADGGNDMTTCHKCGGKGLVHAQDGGDISIPSLTRMDNGAQVKGSQGLNPDFSTNLTAFINAAKADGIDLGIGSGFRTVERQKQLWEQALKKYGSPEKARKWVAPPGRSNHNRGTAVDLNSSGVFLGKNKNTKATQWAHANAEKFGLHFRMGHEPWHIEPLNLSKEQKAKIDAEHQHSDNEDPNTHVDPNNAEALSKEGIDMTKYYKNLEKEPEITDIDNDYSNWNPQEEVVVDPRIAQLNAYSKLMAPSIQNVNDMYAATKINQQQQQKQFAMGGYIDTELTDREIANYKNGGYIVEYLD